MGGSLLVSQIGRYELAIGVPGQSGNLGTRGESFSSKRWRLANDCPVFVCVLVVHVCAGALVGVVWYLRREGLAAASTRERGYTSVIEVERVLMQARGCHEALQAACLFPSKRRVVAEALSRNVRLLSAL